MDKSKNIWNLISNYGNRFWSLVSVFLFIPLYIKYLGIESYAVIGFYSLLLGIISFADSGLSSAVIKEFASSGTAQYKYSILRLIERIYILICFVIAFVIIITAPFIAQKWLTSETIPVADLTYYLRLIGVGISLQLLTSLYFGSMFGLGFQIEANLLQIIWSICKSLGVVFVLILTEETLEVFFIWQILCNLVYLCCIRFRVIYHLEQYGEKLMIIINKIPNTILQYVGGMALIAVISSINSQADKIIMSSVFPLKIYGYYTIASTLSQLPVMLAMPMTISLFPVFSRVVSESKIAQLKIIFTKSSFILNNIVFIALFILIFYTEEIVILWTKQSIETKYLPDVLLATKLLVIGSSLLALQLIFYYVLLAFGKTKYNVVQGILQIIIGIPILYFFVHKIGMTGAGISWIIINLGGLVYLFIINSQNFVKINKFDYIMNSILIPFLISISVCFGFYYLYEHFLFNFKVSAVFSGIVALILNIIYYNIRNKFSLLDFKNLTNLYTE